MRFYRTLIKHRTAIFAAQLLLLSGTALFDVAIGNYAFVAYLLFVPMMAVVWCIPCYLMAKGAAAEGEFSWQAVFSDCLFMVLFVPLLIVGFCFREFSAYAVGLLGGFALFSFVAKLPYARVPGDSR